MVLYGWRHFFDLCGEVAEIRGEVLAMAKGKTANVQGDKTVNVQGANGGKRKIGRPLKILSAEVTKKTYWSSTLGNPAGTHSCRLRILEQRSGVAILPS